MVTLETSFKVTLSLIRQWYTVLILGIQVDDFLPKINGSTEKGSVKNLNVFLSWYPFTNLSRIEIDQRFKVLNVWNEKHAVHRPVNPSFKKKSFPLFCNS